MKQPKPRTPARRLGRPPSDGVTASVRIRVADLATLDRINQLSAAERGDALAQFAVKSDAPKG